MKSNQGTEYKPNKASKSKSQRFSALQCTSVQKGDRGGPNTFVVEELEAKEPFERVKKNSHKEQLLLMRVKIAHSTTIK